VKGAENMDRKLIESEVENANGHGMGLDAILIEIKSWFESPEDKEGAVVIAWQKWCELNKEDLSAYE
jgi:hypothetical protein